MALALGPPGVGRRSGRAASSDRSWRSDPISGGPGRSGPPDGPWRMRRAHGANAARASTSSPRWAVICDSQDTALQHGFRRRRTTDRAVRHAFGASLLVRGGARTSRSGRQVEMVGGGPTQMPGARRQGAKKPPALGRGLVIAVRGARIRRRRPRGRLASRRRPSPVA